MELNESTTETTNKLQPRRKPKYEPLRCSECGYEHRNGHKPDCARYGRMSTEYFIHCLYSRIFTWNMARGALDYGRAYRQPRNTAEMSAEARMLNAEAHIDAIVLERAASIKLEQEAREELKRQQVIEYRRRNSGE